MDLPVYRCNPPSSKLDRSEIDEARHWYPELQTNLNSVSFSKNVAAWAIFKELIFYFKDTEKG